MRVKRPRVELEQELCDQLKLLQIACTSYDAGNEVSGKHISLTLRLLLHHFGNSRSLLEQLGLRNSWFYDTGGPLQPGNYFSECTLVAMRATIGVEAKYVPKCDGPDGAGFNVRRKMPFSDWWTTPVCKDRSKDLLFSRLDLVTNVANTDGGAHVDPSLDEKYERLTRQGGFPWVEISWNLGNGDVVAALLGRPELACMRQIAYEVIITLKERAPKYF